MIPDMTPALEIDGLEAGYGRTPVLHGLDLGCPDGVTAILGPSGCGKTTLLRLVAGFVTPTPARVAVAGDQVVRRRRTMPARPRGLGYVPQEGALFPHLDVAANIAFGLPRASAASAATGSPRCSSWSSCRPSSPTRYPHELSGGQQQRVALARALAPAPDAGAARRAVLVARRGAARGHRPGRRPGAAGGRRRRACSSPTTRARRSRSPTRWR